MNQYFITATFILIIIIIILIFTNEYSNRKSRIIKSNFLICLKVLDMLIDDYYIFYVDSAMKKLRKSFDLEENSQTNSFKQFNQEYADLLNNTTKNIIHDCLSPTIIKELLIYFSIDSLILYITNQLQAKTK